MTEGSVRDERIRSYVLRQGRMTRGQRAGIVRHWARFGLEPDRVLDPVSAFAARRTNPVRPLVLEVGFGMGDSLVEQALATPDSDFLGTEVHGPGVGHLLNRAADADLGNLRVYHADILEVLSNAIPPRSLARVQVFFPDPWPKKKHHKRRLVKEDFIALVHRALVPGGLFHLVTDWPDYAAHIEDTLEGSDLFRTQEQHPVRVTTKYERRARALGHGVQEFVFAAVGVRGPDGTIESSESSRS